MGYRSGTVAIDPGHGGHHQGSRGPTGVLEKTVVLEVARQLALDLEPDYRVVLTRRDDYHVDLHQRTAIANHAKADILISLHAGAAFRHTIAGRTIYYHALMGVNSKRELNNNPPMAQRLWYQAQAKHVQASQKLANVLKKQFDELYSTESCHVQRAPLVVLQGADMPAVLVEVGHITYPDTEKALSTTRGVALLVKAIRLSIDTYMGQRNP